MTDLLPLPSGPVLDAHMREHAGLGISHGQKRRLRKQRASERWLHDGVKTLVHLAAASVSGCCHAATSAQQAAIRHPARQYGSVGHPPADAGTALGAWQTLQGTRLGYSDGAAAGARATHVAGSTRCRAVPAQWIWVPCCPRTRTHRHMETPLCVNRARRPPCRRPLVMRGTLMPRFLAIRDLMAPSSVIFGAVGS